MEVYLNSLIRSVVFKQSVCVCVILKLWFNFAEVKKMSFEDQYTFLNVEFQIWMLLIPTSVTVARRCRLITSAIVISLVKSVSFARRHATHLSGVPSVLELVRCLTGITGTCIQVTPQHYSGGFLLVGMPWLETEL